MKMKKIDKKILCNDNMEMPTKDVLNSAKAAMPEKKKRKVNKKIVFSAAVSFAAVIAVIICIPLMMPAQSEDPNYIGNDELTAYEVNSLSDYGKEYGWELKNFGDEYIESATLYLYNDAAAVGEEKYVVGDTEINLFIKFITDKTFAKEQDYSCYCEEAIDYNGYKLFYYEGEGKLTLRFNDGKIQYRCIFYGGSQENKKELIKKFLE